MKRIMMGVSMQILLRMITDEDVVKSLFKVMDYQDAQALKPSEGLQSTIVTLSACKIKTFLQLAVLIPLAPHLKQDYYLLLVIFF